MKPETLMVVPMKDPQRAKSRLRGVLDRSERTRLALRLFDRTLDMLIDIQAIDPAPAFDIAVVTGDAGIAQRAVNRGVLTIDEGESPGLSAAVRRAADVARQNGYARICVLPADLAVPDPRDIRQLLAIDLGSKGVALCPSRDHGTNALLAAPPDAIDFAYGPRSFHTHCRRAEEAGVTPVVKPLESLRWDIDGPDDLEELYGTAPGVLDQGGRS